MFACWQLGSKQSPDKCKHAWNHLNFCFSPGKIKWIKSFFWGQPIQRKSGLLNKRQKISFFLVLTVA